MIRYRDLTEEHKALICNGCGPKGGFIPVPQFFFHADCDHHDFNYWLGCTRRDRLKADRQFYREMRRDAGLNLVKQAIALTYYLSVCAFGATCFHYAEKQRDENDLPPLCPPPAAGSGSAALHLTRLFCSIASTLPLFGDIKDP